MKLVAIGLSRSEVEFEPQEFIIEVDIAMDKWSLYWRVTHAIHDINCELKKE